MKEFFPILASSPLFSGLSEEELSSVLRCLAAKAVSFPKGAFLLRAGDTVDSVGMLLSGRALIVQEDVWGSRSILANVTPGQTFAAAFACVPDNAANVSVEAETPVTAMFLNPQRLLTLCPSACAHHSRIVQNLVRDLAGKNLLLNEKLTHTTQRSTRAKLMSYLSAQAQRLGATEFDLPFSRQQLADYLAVDRSGLSVELGKMREEGLLEFHRNHFKLRV